MRLNWNGHGRVIRGDYVIEWQRYRAMAYAGVVTRECMHYFIHSLRTNKCILEITVFGSSLAFRAQEAHIWQQKKQQQKH